VLQSMTNMQSCVKFFYDQQFCFTVTVLCILFYSNSAILFCSNSAIVFCSDQSYNQWQIHTVIIHTDNFCFTLISSSFTIKIHTNKFCFTFTSSTIQKFHTQQLHINLHTQYQQNLYTKTTHKPAHTKPAEHYTQNPHIQKLHKNYT